MAQDALKMHFNTVVEAFYYKESSRPLFIYDTVDGNILDTLYNNTADHSWYKIAIIESEYGWFKIQNICRLPNAYINYNYDNHWIKSAGFFIQARSTDKNHSIYLYEEASKMSNRIHKVDNCQVASIIETTDLWAKIIFTVDDKRVEGWLSFEDQFANPWKTCLKYD